jgi:hypothetical protein
MGESADLPISLSESPDGGTGKCAELSISLSESPFTALG